MADKEWKHFETYKIKKHRPCVEVKTARTLDEGNRKLLVGPVESKGEDLLSGKKLQITLMNVVAWTCCVF